MSRRTFVTALRHRHPSLSLCFRRLLILHGQSSLNLVFKCSAEDSVIPASGRGVIKTDLSIAIPSGTYARVAPRSGLAVKHFIDTGAGVVDEDYRGSVGVVLFNHGPSDFTGRPIFWMSSPGRE